MSVNSPELFFLLGLLLWLAMLLAVSTSSEKSFGWIKRQVPIWDCD